MSTLSVKVERIHQEAIDIASFKLVEPNGKTLPPFAPGCHIDVHLGSGLTRQYSLCNGPDDRDHYLIAVKRESESRGGSFMMHSQIKPGVHLSIGKPRNNFPLREAGHHLLLAGGIGITPILSMAKHLLASGASFQVHYFTRSLEHTAFYGLLSAAEYTGKVHFHYALEPEALRRNLRGLLSSRPENARLYICGPQPFMHLAKTSAAPAWPSAVVHVEHFGADPNILDGPQSQFEVRLARSGGVYVVPRERTIVQVLADNGVQIEVSCEQGVCGTCLTGVLEGTPDHRDTFLTDHEKMRGDKMTPCVSRSISPVLVLDI